MTRCQSTIVNPILISSFEQLPLQYYQINCPHIKKKLYKSMEVYLIKKNSSDP